MPRQLFASALSIRIGSPSVSVGPAGQGLASVTTPQLDRLQRQIGYFNPDGTPTYQMQLIWQQTMEAIEGAFEALTGQVVDLTSIVQQIQAAQQLAQTANDNATQAKRQQDITNSYTNPTQVLTASSDGTVAVSAHTRIYGDGSSVSVNAGSVSGFAPGDYVSVFYIDAARTGGAVTYQGTTNAVAQAGDTHSVGQITIPQPGSPPSSGGGVSPPGYTPGGGRTEIEPE